MQPVVALLLTRPLKCNNKIIGNWLDYKEIVEPASPTADIGRTFFDAADGHLKIKKSDGTVLDLETAGGGGGGGGGGMAAGGVIQRSGNSTTTVFTIPHGLSPQPELYWAEPASADAIGNREITVDSTNIIITYGVAPPLAFNNLTFHWAAGYINAASGGFTPSSPTVMTGKTVGDKLAFNKVSVPADQTNAEQGLVYVAEINANNNGLFTKIQKGGVIYEVPIA